MSWQSDVFRNFRLYGVTDIKECSPAMLAAVEQACRGGVDIIQLRSKILSDADLFTIGIQIRTIAHTHHKLFFVNDRLDIALALEADGIHLGQDDLPIAVVRKIAVQVGSTLIIGKSTHSLAQALAAQAEGADYIGVGPIFKTPTKANYAPVGLDLIRQVKQQITIPFVCIGGINRENVGDVMQAGAERIAVVRAIFGAEDVGRAARELKEIIGTNKVESREERVERKN